MRVLTIALALVLVAIGCGSGEDENSMRVRFGATEDSWSATDRSTFVVTCIDQGLVDAETLELVGSEYGLTEEELSALVEDAETGSRTLEDAGFSMPDYCNCVASNLEKRVSAYELTQMEFSELKAVMLETAEPCVPSE
jgi:hypothetical protein